MTTARSPQDGHAPLLTRCDFVNTWECDENEHWNVQFYARAFEQAAEIAALLGGGAAPEPGRLIRHIRYHRELRSRQSVAVHSAEIADGAHRGSVVHLLSEREKAVLCATALDQAPQGARPGHSGLPAIGSAQVEAALPRGVPGGAEPVAQSAALLDGGAALISHYSVVRGAETDHHRRLLFNRVVSRFSDAASQVWTHCGVGEEWFARHNLGRVAVEMKVDARSPAREGDALRMVSWVCDIAEKTFSIRHQVEDVATGEARYLGHVRALVMDLATRKAVSVPDVMRKHACAPGGAA